MPFTSIDFDHALITGPRSRLQALGVIIVNMRDVKQRNGSPQTLSLLKLICTPNVSHLTSLPSEYYGIFVTEEGGLLFNGLWWLDYGYYCATVTAAPPTSFLADPRQCCPLASIKGNQGSQGNNLSASGFHYMGIQRCTKCRK